MTITKSWQGQVLVATLAGELDMKNHGSIAAELDELARANATGIVLNFADVIYIASVGIGLLLNLVKQGRTRGMAVRLAAVRPAVKTLFEIVRLEAALPIDATVLEAVERVIPVAA